jgi:hypothetical protein
MSLPPCIMRLKVINDQHHINLWLPLFLAWIIVGALALVLSPLMALAFRLGRVHADDRSDNIRLRL